MKRFLCASALIAIIAASAAWMALALAGQRPSRPVVGDFQRSKADGSGHTRGIVQVDLMRKIMAEAVGTAPSAGATGGVVPTRDHPLLGRRAPPLVLRDVSGETRDLGEEVSDGPIVVVFYLGFTCVACVTHLVELDAALPRFREQGARVWAVSSDSPEFSRGRIRKFGGFQIPLLSDADRTTSAAYGVWKPAPGGGTDDGTPAHGTFIIGCDGTVRWSYVGDRPFTDIETLLRELSRSGTRSPRSKSAR